MIDLAEHACAEVLDRLAGLGFHRVADGVGSLRPGAYRVRGHSSARIGMTLHAGSGLVMVEAASSGTDLPELAIARLAMLSDMGTAARPYLGLFVHPEARALVERYLLRDTATARRLPPGNRVARIAPAADLGLELAALAGRQPLLSPTL